MQKTTINEKDLIRGLKNGDEESYRYLFDSYYRQLCIYVKKLAGGTPIAEDLVQDVLINIWTKRDKLKIDKSLRNYLYKSVHNQFLLHVRNEKIRFIDLDRLKCSILIDQNLAENDNEIIAVKLDKISAAIDSLPPRCKTAFKLSRYDGFKYKDIAVSMNISQKTVEHQISKALSILRNVQLLGLLLLW